MANSHYSQGTSAISGIFKLLQMLHQYSSITSPLTSLLKGRPSLSWNSEATKAMNTLQKAFTSVLLLVHPDPNHPFIVEVNAFISGVGAALSQEQGQPSQLQELSSPGNSPRQNKITILGIENYWPSSSLMRNGGIGWKGPTNLSPSLPITAIWNIFEKLKG